MTFLEFLFWNLLSICGFLLLCFFPAFRSWIDGILVNWLVRLFLKRVGFTDRPIPTFGMYYLGFDVLIEHGKFKLQSGRLMARDTTTAGKR